MADGKTRSTGGVDWKNMASGRMKPMIAVMGMTAIILIIFSIPLLLRSCPADVHTEPMREATPAIAIDTGEDARTDDGDDESERSADESAKGADAPAPAASASGKDAPVDRITGIGPDQGGTRAAPSSSSTATPETSGTSSMPATTSPAKPSGGSSASGAGTSSGSSSGGGASGGSSSSGGGSSSSQPSTPSKRTCPACGGSGTVKTGTRTVTDSAAWDEYVVDAQAWDEYVVDQEAWSETVYLGIQYSDGAFFAPGEEGAAREHEYSLLESGTDYSNWNVYDTVYHDEVGHTVHHDEVGHTVHHDAVTHDEDTYGTCPSCGGAGKV